MAPVVLRADDPRWAELREQRADSKLLGAEESEAYLRWLEGEGPCPRPNGSPE
jgi:hypothetical protein